MAVCENCGKEFAHIGKSTARFCCHKCRQEGMAKARADKPNMCAWCGKKFKGVGKYCGEACAGKGKAIRKNDKNLYAPKLGAKQ